MADHRAAPLSPSSQDVVTAQRSVSQPVRRPRRGVPHTLLATVIAFAIPWIHGPAPDFLYDAAQYWGGAAALVAGDSPIVPGGLATRGVFTMFVYLPSAWATALIGPGAAVWAVLAWNAALGAVLTVFLIPRLAGLFSSDPLSRPPATRLWASAVIGSLLVSGFAPFPLVDVWATSLALAGFYWLAVSRRWWSLSLAGISLVVASNLRPAMIVPVFLAVVVLLVVRGKPIVVAAPAAVLAGLPQVILNVLRWDLWSPVPRDTVPLSLVQAGPAAYALRYDTVLFADRVPQQWYCDPGYAALLADDKSPRNQLDVVMSAFHHLPDSLWFLFRKAAVNLQWSWATPYENAPDHSTNPMTILVIALSAVGVAALILQTVRLRSDRRGLVKTLAMLAFWFGALATVVFSTPETRFALPVALVGLVGVIAVIPRSLRWHAPSRGLIVTAGCALVLATALFLAGTDARGHDMPPGNLVDAAACANSSAH